MYKKKMGDSPVKDQMGIISHWQMLVYEKEGGNPELLGRSNVTACISERMRCLQDSKCDLLLSKQLFNTHDARRTFGKHGQSSSCGGGREAMVCDA
jgi:hypothetical protein